MRHAHGAVEGRSGGTIHSHARGDVQHDHDHGCHEGPGSNYQMLLLCDECTWVYRGAFQRDRYMVGVKDPLCDNRKSPGTLVVAPDDAIPNTYYDSSKDRGVRCVVPR